MVGHTSVDGIKSVKKEYVKIFIRDTALNSMSS